MDQQKKTLCIAGSMILPIAIGQPAVIMERDGGYRQTTTVLNVKKLSESVIKFETQNTRYLLHLTSDTKKAVTVGAKNLRTNASFDGQKPESIRLSKWFACLVIYPGPQTIPTRNVRSSRFLLLSRLSWTKQENALLQVKPVSSVSHCQTHLKSQLHLNGTRQSSCLSQTVLTLVRKPSMTRTSRRLTSTGIRVVLMIRST